MRRTIGIVAAAAWRACGGPIGLAALGLVFFVVAAAVVHGNMRTSSPNLGTSQGVGSAWENIRDLWDKMLSHRHDGTDGSSRLKDPYIDGDVILQSPDGACWSCGPDNAGTWGCSSTTCP